MGMSSLATWTLSQPAVASDLGAMRVASLLAFTTGGFGHTATLGLLLAGVSVPSLAFRLMPPWLCWFDRRRYCRAVKHQHAVSLSLATPPPRSIPSPRLADCGGILDSEEKGHALLIRFLHFDIGLFDF